jgi:hypothetical protein
VRALAVLIYRRVCVVVSAVADQAMGSLGNAINLEEFENGRLHQH